MTREEAEDSIWTDWRDASEWGMGCAMQVDPSRTEAYEWGWVVVLVPVRREECRQPCHLKRYAIEPKAGRSYPVGSKGLGRSLKQLGVVSAADFQVRSSAERLALWDRLITPCTEPSGIGDQP